MNEIAAGGWSNRTRAIIAANIGAVFEWYDLLVYAFLASTLSKLFFPSTDENMSTLLTLGTFGLSWLARPLGAIVIGGYSDRHGRKAGLTLSATLMTIGVLLTAVLPTYASIGIAAPALLMLARLIQGFSAGGEFGAANTFLTEQSPQRRGLLASMQFSATGISTLLAAGFAYFLLGNLTPEQAQSWGWRLPYVFGLLIGPVAYYMRAHMDDSPEYSEADASKTPLRETWTHDKWRVLAGAAVVAAGAAGSFMNTYMPTFAITKLGLPASTVLLGSIAVGVVNTIFSLVSGHLADRFGSVLVMRTAGIIGIIVAYPLFWWLINNPSVPNLIIFQSILAFLYYSMYYAPVGMVLYELFPVRRRTTGVSVAYVFAQTFFGGVTPFIVSALISATGTTLTAGVYLMAATVLGQI
ncbi:MAG: MFS transporter, partial [Alphaproteobacteria bacterium]|nr:MFS transporter [Alphaproteobacteria bacterium]